MRYILDIWNQILSVVQTISIIDIIDMLLLSFLLYKGIKLVRETRAQQLVKGIILICVGYFVVSLLKLKTMSFLLDNFFQWGIIALVILFQPELRRILDKMGRTKVSSKFNIFNQNDPDEADAEGWNTAIEAVCDATVQLAATCTGALIVIERQTRLGEQIDTGTILNCTPSAEIFGNIFFPNTPLHDGAVIMRNAKILAAGCFLPKPQKEELINKQLGSRHRAAIGMSENSDAIVIAVSEETGTISVAEDGELTRGFTKDSLRKLLKARLVPEKPADDNKDKSIGRVISKWKK